MDSQQPSPGEDRLFPADPHTWPLAEAAGRLGSDAEQGLSADEAAARLAAVGRNELAAEPPEPAWRRLLAQFRDLVIWILIVAAVLSGFLGDWFDTAAILAIVLLNGVIGFLQEERAARALAALRNLSAPLARCVRKGSLTLLPAAELVPGDLIELAAGDFVPADARLVQAYGLTVQEAALTGESLPVAKDAQAVLPAATLPADCRNMAFQGTIVASGKGRALVVATGMRTALGRIAGLLKQEVVEPTPLQRRLAELGRVLVAACLAIVAVIFGLQVLRGSDPLEALLLAVSLAVAAVPEGLPAVVTIALAIGLQRMVRRQALIRKLPSVETLGCVTVICSDKTGTLTRNEMTVQEVVTARSWYRVTGGGYRPQGAFLPRSTDPAAEDLETIPAADPGEPDRDADLLELLAAGVWCNNAKLQLSGSGEPAWGVLGDPTEGALLVLAGKAGLDPDSLPGTILYELPFDSTRKAMSVAVQTAGGRRMLYTKGAPEVILGWSATELSGGAICPLTADRRRDILARNSRLAAAALRVLALACRPDPPPPDQNPESPLTFLGLVGMIDPPRDEATAAVARCRQAGIRPLMITGDHPATALAIGRAMGLAGPEEHAVTGAELDALSDQELAARLDWIAVFARVTAEHKLRIVRAWQGRGEVVAMTGDGVNDAPAVQAANIGIAMGITGTDVTKEAADMVLLDDNFASIVSAVEEGRGIYDNIRKVLLFLVSCNFGEILLMLVASLLGWPAPLLPVQLLWINLVTDGLPALALSLEPPEESLMRRRPRHPQARLLTWRLGLLIAWQGALQCGVTLAAFAWGMSGPGGGIERARGLAFCVLVYTELFRALAARSPRRTFWELGPLTNPWLLLAVVVSGLLQASVVVVPPVRRVFGVPGHGGGDAPLVLALALAPAMMIELGKLLARWWKRPPRR